MKITEENLIDINPSVLADPQSYLQIEDMMVSVDAAYTPEYSKQYAILLSSKLQAAAQSIKPDLMDKYMRLLKLLRLGSLRLVNDGEKERYFREMLVDTLRLDFARVKEWIENCFAGYHKAQDIIENNRRIFLKGLENNIEALGSVELHIPAQEREAAPTIKNWILDYNRTTPITTGRKDRGRLEEGKYMTSSANVQKLEVKDRQILLKVLEIYDWLKFSALKYDFSFPDDPKFPDVEKEGPHILIPQELANLVNNIRASSRKVKISAPVVVPQAVVPKTTFTAPVSTRPPQGKVIDGLGVTSKREPLDNKKQYIEDQRKVMEEIAKFEPASKPLGFSASALSKVSLSQAIANADQDSLPAAGNIRVGKKIETPSPTKPAIPVPPKPFVSQSISPQNVLSGSKPISLMAPLAGNVQRLKATPETPPLVQQRPKVINFGPGSSIRPATPTTPPPSFGQAGLATRTPSSIGQVIDLTKKEAVKVSEIKTPEELSKIDYKDIDGRNITEWLSEIKNKISFLSREFGLPLKQIAAHFYKSPLYVLYGSMAVAVMNDTSTSDQAILFDKIIKNYQVAKRDYLTREQFLALNQFKRELATMESVTR